MSLKPFTYPLPETRFLHAGRHVYKFKIRYGNFNSSPNLSLTESAAKESEEVIRIILGNLDDLHPFSTDHFTVFPFKINCCQHQTCNPLKFRKRNEMSESTAMKEAVKRRRVEIEDDTSCPQSCMDRTGADCVHHMSKSKQGFEKNSSKANELEFSPASLTKDCDQLSFWGPVEFALEQKRTVSQAEGAVQLLQQVDQTGKKGNMKSEGRGLSQFWRSIIFSPLQHLFGGKN
ncbi:membrane-anchored junction protein isoform 3-T5 [Geothlypis trichas]